MITYFKMKYMEWKIKKAAYETIISVVANYEDIVDMIIKLVDLSRDMTPDEMKSQFISALAESIHKDNQEEK